MCVHCLLLPGSVNGEFAGDSHNYVGQACENVCPLPRANEPQNAEALSIGNGIGIEIGMGMGMGICTELRLSAAVIRLFVAAFNAFHLIDKISL